MIGFSLVLFSIIAIAAFIMVAASSIFYIADFIMGEITGVRIFEIVESACAFFTDKVIYPFYKGLRKIVLKR